MYKFLDPFIQRQSVEKRLFYIALNKSADKMLSFATLLALLVVRDIQNVLIQKFVKLYTRESKINSLN